MADGFPYGKFPDMRETCIVLPDRSKTSYLTAVNFVAMDIPENRISSPSSGWWQTKLPDSLDKDIICVTLTSALPDRIVESGAVKVEIARVPELSSTHPFQRDMIRTKGKGFWSKLIPSNESRVVDLSLVDFDVVVTRMDPILLNQRAAMLQFQSPAGKRQDNASIHGALCQ